MKFRKVLTRSQVEPTLGLWENYGTLWLQHPLKIGLFQEGQKVAWKKGTMGAKSTIEAFQTLPQQTKLQAGAWGCSCWYLNSVNGGLLSEDNPRTATASTARMQNFLVLQAPFHSQLKLLILELTLTTRTTTAATRIRTRRKRIGRKISTIQRRRKSN